MKDKLKQSAGDGMVVLDDAISLDEATYKISNSPGEVVDNFEIKADMGGKAIVFSDADIKNVVGQTIAKAGDGNTDLNGSPITLDYGKAETDIKSGSVVVTVHGTVQIKPNIDMAVTTIAGRGAAHCLTNLVKACHLLYMATLYLSRKPDN